MIKLRLRREKIISVSKNAHSIIRLRNCCGWPFNLVGCSKVAHLESKKKSTQKTSFHHFSGIKNSTKPIFLRIRWVKETIFFIFSIYCNKFTMCDQRKPWFYLFLYFRLYVKFPFFSKFVFLWDQQLIQIQFNWNLFLLCTLHIRQIR